MIGHAQVLLASILRLAIIWGALSHPSTFTALLMLVLLYDCKTGSNTNTITLAEHYYNCRDHILSTREYDSALRQAFG